MKLKLDQIEKKLHQLVKVSALTCLFLILIVAGLTFTQIMIQNIGKIAGQLEDPLEAWSEANYIVWKYNSTFYAARNMSTNLVEFSGTNASQIINNAFNSLTVGRTWKEIVQLKSAEFILTASLEIPSYTIFDLGGATLKLADSTTLSTYLTDHSSVVHNSNPFTSSGNHDIEIRNGVVDVNGAQQTKIVGTYQYQGIALAWVYRALVENIVVKNALTFGFAFWPVNQAPYPQVDSVFTNLVADNNGDSDPAGTAGFWFSAGAPAQFKGSFIDNILATNNDAFAGIEFEANIESNSVGKLYAYNNVLHGVAFVTSDKVNSNFYIVSHDNGGDGLYIQGSQYVVVRGDFYNNGGNGIYCDSSFNTFESVTSINNSKSGLYITGGGNVQVIGGMFKENGQNVSSTYRNGITIVNSERDTITGIQGLDYQGVKTQQYAVQSLGTSNYLILTSSLAYGNAIGGSNLVGANNELGHNIGF